MQAKPRVEEHSGFLQARFQEPEMWPGHQVTRQMAFLTNRLRAPTSQPGAHSGLAKQTDAVCRGRGPVPSTLSFSAVL